MSAAPGLPPGCRLQAPDWRKPVFIIIGLTDDEREDLSRRVGEVNKRSKNGSGQ